MPQKKTSYEVRRANGWWNVIKIVACGDARKISRFVRQRLVVAQYATEQEAEAKARELMNKE